MNKHQRIILEFTPEEVRLLAYGIVPDEVKKRLTQIAYYIDDKEKENKQSHRIPK